MGKSGGGGEYEKRGEGEGIGKKKWIQRLQKHSL